MTGSSAVHGTPSPRQVAVGLSPTSPLSVVDPAELELVRPAPATATKVESERRLTGAWQSVAPVVKRQTSLWARATPRWFLTPVVTLEAVGPFAAIGRAWRLGKAHFWMLVMFQIAIGLIGGLVGLGIAALTANLTSMPTVTLLTAIGTSLTAPLGIIGATLLYIDARVRYDGLNDDLAYLGRLDARLNELPVRRAEGSLLGGSDVLNMIILVVLFVALSILLGVFGRSLGLIPNTPTTSATSLLIIKQSIGL